MVAVRVQQIGDELGVLLDKAARDSLGISDGDMLTISKAPNGIEINAEQDDRSDAIARGRAILLRYRKTFEALAK